MLKNEAATLLWLSKGAEFAAPTAISALQLAKVPYVQLKATRRTVTEFYVTDAGVYRRKELSGQ